MDALWLSSQEFVSKGSVCLSTSSSHRGQWENYLILAVKALLPTSGVGGGDGRHPILYVLTSKAKKQDRGEIRVDFHCSTLITHESLWKSNGQTTRGVQNAIFGKKLFYHIFGALTGESIRSWRPGQKGEGQWSLSSLLLLLLPPLFWVHRCLLLCAASGTCSIKTYLTLPETVNS